MQDDAVEPWPPVASVPPGVNVEGVDRAGQLRIRCQEPYVPAQLACDQGFDYEVVIALASSSPLCKTLDDASVDIDWITLLSGFYCSRPFG